MAHIEKFKRKDVARVCNHFERTFSGNGIPDNRNIDPTRTYLNYNLAEHNEAQMEFINKRCAEVRCNPRADLNILASCCLFLPKDVPPEDERRFFESAYRFLSDRYGKNNIVSAWVHKDEGFKTPEGVLINSPHIHFAFIPVANRDTDKECISAKLVINRRDLQTLHTDMETTISNDFGRKISILTGALKDRKLMSMPEYKRYKQLQRDIGQLERRKTELHDEIFDLEGTDFRPLFNTNEIIL
ncbi:MAG: plasmid recombination protein [Clostridia bacterium]|nr:plasmid recombination protein [Clostridia bacterium]